MTVDDAPLRTRRALLTGGFGGAVALVAAALGRPLPGQAADGDAIHVGDEIEATKATVIRATGATALVGVSDDPEEPGLQGLATSSIGPSVGVRGRSAGGFGAGVAGYADAPSGPAVGVAGQSASTDGIGVNGLATSLTGKTTGVSGQTMSTDGRGVKGEALAPSGEGVGVWGETHSTEGLGVVGLATATSGQAFGVGGRNFSTEGAGVSGEARARSGDTVGVFGRSDSGAGIGTMGWSSADGTGLLGYSGPLPRPAAQGATGVYGFAAQEEGRGGWFVGNAAQIRLEPGSGAHPESGQTGDLFVDDEGRLWFCAGDTDWKRLA
jgi:hypothetical protein